MPPHSPATTDSSGHSFALPRPLQWWHLNSLDAPTVAVLWQLAFARAVGVRLPLWIPFALGLACWSFYMLDRLLDARRSLRSANIAHLRARHTHHWRFRKILFPLAVAAFVAAALIALTQMPRPAFLRNSLLAASALLYFSRVHGAWRPRRSTMRFKELFVALIFTAACVVPVFSRVERPLRLLPAMAAFTALAWLNCHAIDVWERPQSAWLPPALRHFAALAAALLLPLTAFLAPAHAQLAPLLLCALISAVLLFLLDRFRHHVSPLTLRIAADLALLTPALLLPPGFNR